MKVFLCGAGQGRVTYRDFEMYPEDVELVNISKGDFDFIMGGQVDYNRTAYIANVPGVGVLLGKWDWKKAFNTFVTVLLPGTVIFKPEAKSYVTDIIDKAKGTKTSIVDVPEMHNVPNEVFSPEDTRITATSPLQSSRTVDNLSIQIPGHGTTAQYSYREPGTYQPGSVKAKATTEFKWFAIPALAITALGFFGK